MAHQTFLTTNRNDPGAWRFFLSNYDSAIKSLNASRRNLVSLELFMWDYLTPKIQASHAMSADDFMQIFDWKTTRVKSMGVMNRKKVESNPSKILESSTQKAFAALKHPEISSPDEVKRALLELTKPLKGIGPATASAVLAVYSETIPFMSDEAVLSLITKKGSNLHDMNNYLAYYARVCELVTELNSTTGEGDPIQWNARNVERALWTARMDEVLGLGLLNLYLEQNEQKESAQEKIVDPDDDDKLDSQNLKGKKPEKRNLERSEESFGDDGSEKKLKRDNDTEDDKK